MTAVLSDGVADGVADGVVNGVAVGTASLLTILNIVSALAPVTLSHFPRLEATIFASIGYCASVGIPSFNISIFHEYEPSEGFTVLTAFAGP